MKFAATLLLNPNYLLNTEICIEGKFSFAQIENEYGPMEYEIGSPGKAYSQWAASMAIGLGTGVPWVMCKQDDAPDPIVSSVDIYLFNRNIFTFYRHVL